MSNKKAQRFFPCRQYENAPAVNFAGAFLKHIEKKIQLNAKGVFYGVINMYGAELKSVKAFSKFFSELSVERYVGNREQFFFAAAGNFVNAKTEAAVFAAFVRI